MQAQTEKGKQLPHVIEPFNVRPFMQQNEPPRFFVEPFRKVNVRPEQAEDERAGNAVRYIHARRDFLRAF